MKREEAIKIATDLRTNFKCESETMIDFCNTIIKALENQYLGKGIDCGDCPANEPKTNIGHWVKEDDIITHCSECGQRIMTCQDWFEYCPKCGARMTDKGGTR